MRAVVVGGLNLDVVVNVPRLPLPGESLPASAWDLVPGGKGGNQAVAVRRLGGDVVMVARVGADEFGARLRRSLQSEGVDDAGEAAALTGVRVDDSESAEGAGRILLHRGADAAVVKRGRAGAVIVTAETATHVPPFPVASVDATAAGDAFAAGLAVALMRGEDLRAAVRFASAAAAMSTTHPGAQPSMPTGDEVMRFLAGVTAAGYGA